MVELARLERVYGRKVIQGSNPCLSASKFDYCCFLQKYSGSEASLETNSARH